MTTAKRRPRRANSLKDLGQLMNMAESAQPIVPERRRRKTVLTPPIIDPPRLYGFDGEWPVNIATIRSLPYPNPYIDNGPAPLGVWIDNQPHCSVERLVNWFNANAQEAGLHIALVLRDRGETFDIWQTQPGATERCEQTDRGVCGQFLRLLKRFPRQTPEDREQERQDAVARNNAGIVEAAQRRASATAAPRRRKPVVQIVYESERLIYGDASRPVPVYLHRFDQGADS